MNHARGVAIGQSLLIIILGSLGTVLTKVSLRGVAPLTFAALSVLVGIVALNIYTFVIKRERIPASMGRRVWLYIILIGLCNFSVAQVFTTLSLERMPASTNAFLINFVGFVTMGMSIFLLKETPSLFQLGGAIIAMVGLRIFFAAIPPVAELIGIVLLGMAVLAIALTNNLARKLALLTANQLSNSIISTLALTIGGGLAVIVGLIAEWPVRVGGVENWGSIVYAGAITIALGKTGWNYVLRTLRSYEASMLGASSIIWTTLIAVPVLGEHISGNQGAGMALLILGLVCVQFRGRVAFRAW